MTTDDVILGYFAILSVITGFGLGILFAADFIRDKFAKKSNLPIAKVHRDG